MGGCALSRKFSSWREAVRETGSKVIQRRKERTSYEQDGKGRSGEERERERVTERGWVSIRVPERSSQIRAEGVTY